MSGGDKHSLDVLRRDGMHVFLLRLYFYKDLLVIDSWVIFIP